MSQVVTQGISYLDVKKYTGLKAALRTETKKVALLASRRHKESADTNLLMPDGPVPRCYYHCSNLAKINSWIYKILAQNRSDKSRALLKNQNFEM